MKYFAVILLLIPLALIASVTFVVNGRVVTLNVPAWADSTGALATKSDVGAKSAISDTLTWNATKTDLLVKQANSDTATWDGTKTDLLPLTADADSSTWLGTKTNDLTKQGMTGASLSTSGNVDVTFAKTSSVFTIVPAGDCTFRASGISTAGQRCTFVISTSGTTSRTLTWSTGFTATGTLATGTVDRKLFTISFVYDGTAWRETARTTAM